MVMVVRVRFKRASKLYDFDPNGLDLHNGMHVVTETARGVELGECVSGIIGVPDDRVSLPLKPIIRIATEQDLAVQRRNEQAEKEAFDIAMEKIAEHELEMKLVDVEYAFDHSKIIFYFTANGRVDFRMLVKNLAGIFKTRIELRQIGVRDEAKMLGGIGPCGRPICCRTYLGDFTPVSIKMAKEQNLSLNPTKISGLCDRLMCCLKYEQDHYETTRKRMPRVGREIITPDGPGTINAINVLSETVRVRIAVGDAFELREYPIDDCQRPNQDQRPNQEQQPNQGEAAPKKERPTKPERSEKPEQAEQPEGEKPRREKNDRPEKSERSEKSQRDKKNEGDKPRQEKGERPEQGDKPRREKEQRAPKQHEKKQPDKKVNPQAAPAPAKEETKAAAKETVKESAKEAAKEAVKAAAKEVEKETVKPVEDAVVEIVETAALEDLL